MKSSSSSRAATSIYQVGKQICIKSSSGKAITSIYQVGKQVYIKSSSRVDLAIIEL